MSNNIWQATIVKNGGDVVSGADIEVIDEDTGLAATIYNTRTSTTPMSNPFASDANGFAVFYASAGKYKITATQASTGFASEPLRFVRLGEGGAKDTGTGITQIPLNSDLGTSATKDTGTADDNIQVVGPGSIIRHETYTNTATADEGAASATIPIQTSIQYSYTPERMDTNITVQCSGNFLLGRSSAGQMGLYVQLRDGTTVLKSVFIYSSQSSFIHTNPNLCFVDSRYTASTKNYRIWIAPHLGLENIYYTPGKGAATMTITESLQ